MQITIKSVKVGASGTNDKGDWELIVVTADDGSEFTTFDKSAKHINPGSVIEFEPKVKNNKTGFTKFTVISQGSVPPPTEVKRESSTNQSIEAQTAYKGLIEIYDKLEETTQKRVIAWALIKMGVQDAKTNTKLDSRQDEPGDTGGDDTGRVGQAAKELMEWALEHGKEYGPSWVRKESKIGDKIITDEMAKQAKSYLRTLMSWTD